jgi:hypothetical protein
VIRLSAGGGDGTGAERTRAEEVYTDRAEYRERVGDTVTEERTIRGPMLLARDRSSR